MKLLACLLAGVISICASAGAPAGLITFNDDGAWCWFQDERVLVHRGKLIIGSVAGGAHDASRAGNIEAAIYDLKTGKRTVVVLHANLAETPTVLYDDHNSPAFLALPDGRVIAVYSRHGRDNRSYSRITRTADDPTQWGEQRVFIPSETSRITYSNLYWLSLENAGKGRLYNFFRGLHNSFKPSYMFSDDAGLNWQTGNVYIDVPSQFRHRPYVRYASDGRARVHMLYTEGHPRDFNNSVYHIYYESGRLHRSDGTPIRALTEGLRDPTEGTRVFAGDPNNVAWVSDVHLDRRGRPFAAYSVQKDSAGLPPKQGGEDHRYRYARWNGSAWTDFEIACAGRRLYAGEDDYTGNIALDPEDPNTVFISTDAHPSTCQPLISKADGQRHYEIFRGVTADAGATWKWTPVTQDSAMDNLRPIVPLGREQRVLLWLRGKYNTYTNYDLDVVGLVELRR